MTDEIEDLVGIADLVLRLTAAAKIHQKQANRASYNSASPFLFLKLHQLRHKLSHTFLWFILIYKA